MEVFECIKTRRSVRRFEDRPVERETIQKIVDAAFGHHHGKILRHRAILW